MTAYRDLAPIKLSDRRWDLRGVFQLQYSEIQMYTVSFALSAAATLCMMITPNYIHLSGTQHASSSLAVACAPGLTQ